MTVEVAYITLLQCRPELTLCGRRNTGVRQALTNCFTDPAVKPMCMPAAEDKLTSVLQSGRGAADKVEHVSTDIRGTGIAQWLERGTRDRKVADSSPAGAAGDRERKKSSLWSVF